MSQMRKRVRQIDLVAWLRFSENVLTLEDLKEGMKSEIDRRFSGITFRTEFFSNLVTENAASSTAIAKAAISKMILESKET